MYEHIALIYNPYAGGLRGTKLARLDQAENALRLQGRQVTRYSTRGPRTAGNVARECLRAGCDLIVAAGGDGTINEVADGLIGSPVPLGVLPAGTANVLANELGLDHKLGNAAQAFPGCVAQAVPMGMLRFEDGTAQHFLLMAGAGLDANIVFHLDAGWKARLGKAAYWMGGFQLFWKKLDEFDVELEGTRHRCSFALITKVRNYGGDFEIARNVKILDRKFEVVLFEGVNTYRYLGYFAAVAANRLRSVPGVTIYRTEHVQLLPRNGNLVHCQVDGEYAGKLPVTVSSDGQTVRLLIPKTYLDR